MKISNNNTLGLGMLGALTVLFLLFGGTGKSKVTVDKEEMDRVLAEADSTIKLLDELTVKLDKIEVHSAKYNANFDYVYPKFKAFNENIDTFTVHHFVKVMMHYELDETEYKREMYTGQILLESGAKQYRPNGDLVRSSAGATGICQIMPNTCRGYFDKMSTQDSLDFIELGANDFSFAYDNSLNRSQKNVKCSKWLADETNNIIMWGFITRHNLNKKGDIHKQLVAYNAGTGGMQSYVTNGGKCVDHTYVKGIKNKLSVTSH